MVQRLEDQSSPDDIFRSVAVRALHLSNGGNEEECVLNELCSQPGLAQVNILYFTIFCLGHVMHHKYLINLCAIRRNSWKCFVLMYQGDSRKKRDHRIKGMLYGYPNARLLQFVSTLSN